MEGESSTLTFILFFFFIVHPLFSEASDFRKYRMTCFLVILLIFSINVVDMNNLRRLALILLLGNRNSFRTCHYVENNLCSIKFNSEKLIFYWIFTCYNNGYILEVTDLYNWWKAETQAFAVSLALIRKVIRK